YQLGLKAHTGSADLNAKAGAAALHVGDYAAPVDACVLLGERDGSRAGEAADGLERVARAALAANDRGDAAKGLAGLRAVAPTRPLGRYNRLAALDAADRGDTAGAMVLLPGAVAAAADARIADSLLFVYGMAAVRARDCATAVPAFEGVIRRQREPAVADRAREGLGLCSLVEGQRLLDTGKPTEAEAGFRRATAPGPPCWRPATTDPASCRPRIRSPSWRRRAPSSGAGTTARRSCRSAGSRTSWAPASPRWSTCDTISPSVTSRRGTACRRPTSSARSRINMRRATTRPWPCCGRAMRTCGCGGNRRWIPRTAKRLSPSTRSWRGVIQGPMRPPERRCTCSSPGSGFPKRTTRTGCSTSGDVPTIRRSSTLRT